VELIADQTYTGIGLAMNNRLPSSFFLRVLRVFAVP
jgi:hypothetical protein